MQNPRLDFLREKTSKLPMEPGVYLMKNVKKEIIYVGKAKELRNRVGSYFRAVEKHTEKVYRMVENVYNFDYIVTSSEFEALVLEASLIKLHNPRYNILLKDDKGYSYIKISDDPFPRITAEKMRQKGDKSLFLGPYTSSLVVTRTVEEVNHAFQLPTCSRKFPQDFGKQRPCLNYHIKRCLGYCTGKISQEKYNDIIKQALGFIRSGSGSTIKALETQMEQAAENLDYEKAAELRDKIKSIKKITEQQNVVFVKSDEQDVLALVQSENSGVMVVLKIRGQRLVDKQDFFIENIDNQKETRREFILSYYGSQLDIPPIISIDGECEDQELLSLYLSEKAGRQTAIHLPQRGEKVRLVEMARQNAAQVLSHRFENASGKDLAVLDQLAVMLGLSSTPRYIEAYDISNMGDETMVGGMVVFEDGKPQRSAYRKFNIKTVEGPDDYASMREVISRRLARYDSEKDTGEGFGRLPDLILLDGGKGHVSAVTPIVEDMGFTLPVYGLVKDSKHRTRAIATDGGEISIQANRSAFTLLSTIQEEVHRFSISHMRSRRTKNAFTSQLTSVQGIGEKRMRELLLHFKTQKALRDASVEELAAVRGMSLPAAENLHTFFHSDD